jgi:predicted O-methyltransferase YrrM
MTQERWTAVDRYISDLLVPADPALDAVLESSAAAGLPAISVSPPLGKLLHLIARVHGARSVLEIGTLAGYSTIWLARALGSGGRMVTLEIDPAHAEIARTNLARAGVADRVDLRLGPALEALPRLAAEHRGPFDLIFIDADKQHTSEYFAWALTLSRSGSVIIVDNVVRNGDVIDADNEDPRVQAMRRFHQQLAADSRVTATILQTVGSKGYDGFAIALVV